MWLSFFLLQDYTNSEDCGNLFTEFLGPEGVAQGLGTVRVSVLRQEMHIFLGPLWSHRYPALTRNRNQFNGSWWKNTHETVIVYNVQAQSLTTDVFFMLPRSFILHLREWEQLRWCVSVLRSPSIARSAERLTPLCVRVETWVARIPRRSRAESMTRPQEVIKSQENNRLSVLCYRLDC